MKRTTHTLPELVYYIYYSDCNIQDAILNEFILSENHTLTLPQLNRIRVNGNALVGSYGQSIMQLRKKGFQIKTEIDRKDNITRSRYILLNPSFSGDIND